VSLPGGHQDHRLAELLQPLCHCAVTARSDLRESGTATMSALNLWNKNTERVSDALSRDRDTYISQLSLNTLQDRLFCVPTIYVMVNSLRRTPRPPGSAVFGSAPA